MSRNPITKIANFRDLGILWLLTNEMEVHKNSLRAHKVFRKNTQAETLLA
jgi:hypothetical protein